MSSEADTAGSRWAAVERMVYAAIAGGVAVAAPLLLFWAAASTADIWAVPWVAAPIIGPLVFQLISRPRPEWGWGLAFAAALGVVFGIWGGFRPPFEYSGAGQAALVGASFFVLTFLVGMVGASIASLITRLFELQSLRLSGAPGHIKPWHAGVALTAAEIVAVAVLVAGLRP